MALLAILLSTIPFVWSEDISLLKTEIITEIIRVLGAAFLGVFEDYSQFKMSSRFIKC